MRKLVVIKCSYYPEEKKYVARALGAIVLKLSYDELVRKLSKEELADTMDKLNNNFREILIEYNHTLFNSKAIREGEIEKIIT